MKATKPRAFATNYHQHKSRAPAYHLNTVFGLAEIFAGLIRLTDIPAFEKEWLQYCELFNASQGRAKGALGTGLGKLNLQQAHARFTALRPAAVKG